MAEIPRYDQYQLVELYQALNSIAVDKYPDTLAALEREINQRNPQSRHELEESYYTLDKKRWPHYEALLRQQISELPQAVEVPEAPPIFGGFWRRFWAQAIDVYAVLGLTAPLHYVMMMRSREMAILTCLSPLVSAAYFVTTHACWGRSIGKAVLGLKVLDKSGEPLSLRNTVLRYSVDMALWAAFAAFAAYVIIQVPRGEFLELNYLGRITLIVGHSFAIPLFLVGIAWIISNVLVLLASGRNRAIHDFLGRSCVVNTTGDVAIYPVGKVIVLLALPAFGNHLLVTATSTGGEDGELLMLMSIGCYVVLLAIVVTFARAAFRQEVVIPQIAP